MNKPCSLSLPPFFLSLSISLPFSLSFSHSLSLPFSDYSNQKQQKVLKRHQIISSLQFPKTEILSRKGNCGGQDEIWRTKIKLIKDKTARQPKRTSEFEVIYKEEWVKNYKSRIQKLLAVYKNNLQAVIWQRSGTHCWLRMVPKPLHRPQLQSACEESLVV